MGSGGRLDVMGPGPMLCDEGHSDALQLHFAVPQPTKPLTWKSRGDDERNKSGCREGELEHDEAKMLDMAKNSEMEYANSLPSTVRCEYSYYSLMMRTMN